MASRKFRSLLTTAVVMLMASGCSIMHPVGDDYSQYLSNNTGARQFQTVEAGKQYYLPPSTQSHRYEFRSATVGYAHVWVVEFGKILDATMQSKDVVDALGLMKKASSDRSDAGNTIVFDLQNYSFEHHGAHLGLTISVKTATREIFRKAYRADGNTQGGKMFWGGPFAMKNAVQQSTKSALDEIINNFIRDFQGIAHQARDSASIG